MRQVIATIDIEPSWEQIVNMWLRYEMLNPKDKATIDGLYQMAKVCDIVRKAQKEGKKTLKL